MTTEVDEQSGLTALVCNSPYLLSGIFRGFPDKLLIRDCVEDTIKEISSEDPQIPILITGTPGIGKSVSIFVLLHKIVNGEINNVDNIVLDIQIANNLYIVYKSASGNWDEVVLMSRTTNDISDFVESKVSSRIKLSTAEIFKATWYIYDGCISTQPLAVNPCIKRIVFSSPNIGHFKVYAKNPSLYVHYVPAWELHEIRAAFDVYSGKAFSLKVGRAAKVCVLRQGEVDSAT
jgi:RHS (Retrotransposon Hot Spot) family protein